MERHEKAVPQTVPHHLILQDRQNLELTGVTMVERFDEVSVCCRTSVGVLLIQGDGLRVQSLDVEGTALSVLGKIDSLTYTEVRKGGVFGRLLR